MSSTGSDIAGIALAAGVPRKQALVVEDDMHEVLGPVPREVYCICDCNSEVVDVKRAC